MTTQQLVPERPAREVRTFVTVVASVAALLVILGTLAGCGGDDEPDEDRGTKGGDSGFVAPTHLSAQAWQDLVTGLEENAETTIAYDVIIGEESADVLVPDGDASRTWTLADGAWTSATSSVQAPQTVDLATIDAEMVGTLPERAMEDLGFSSYTSMALSVKDSGDGVALSVFVKGDDNPATRTRTYDTDGNPV